MQRRTFLAASSAAAALAGLAPAASAAKTAGAMTQPMLAPFTGPHGGAPAWDKVRIDDFKPAIEAGIEAQRAEITAIATNKAPPTFENTVAALEDAGRPLGRVLTYFYVYTSTLNDKPMQAIEKEMSPVLAAAQDEVVQNAALFARIKAVHEAMETSGLTPEQKRLTEVTYRRFARTGAALSPPDKARLAQINQRLAVLYAQFGQNELADEETYTLPLTSQADLAGLPDWLVASAATAAEAKGLKGQWLITNTRSSMEPFLTYSARRDLREKGFRMWAARGDNGGEHDNNAVIVEILKLRAERAKLLGFKTHAHWITDDQMAKTPEAAMDLMLKVWAPAVARVREEVADMQALADAEKAGITIAPWDYRYYAEKVRKAKYDLDENEIKPYLQLEKLREGVFWAAGQLYGFEFVQVTDLPTARPDIRTFEVRRDGQRVGLWYFDPYARAGKNSGAWMNEYRTQETFKGTVTPIVSNNANFIPGKPGEPILISWDDATTMFHEFGHALHGLNSDVTYPSLAGTNVVRDFVEFPSQLNEHWLPTREVLSRFAVHHQTGAPMPDELVAKIKKAKTFNQGFATVEYLASAIVDMKVHLAGDATIDPKAFEAETLKEIGMPSEIIMRHRMPHFGHIFSGDGYSAGYYDYIWADTLTADAAEAFEEAPGGFYDKAVAKKLHDCIMSVGNTIEAGEAFRRFRGRDVTIDALMRDRGFPAPAKAT
ncbi:MAG TPA: M3 family metallopeptidase [Caulobacteraceae bacterium]|nr:M3 family metallopeptidase [Caulobacteraceae bacterium]